MSAHIGYWLHVILGFIAFVIADRARFRRFIRLALLVGLGVGIWWLLGDGGLQALLRDIGPASITRPRSGPR